ncbi:hypothetical protein BD626DRAFT_549493 [Schizophyllum amplum]|uniref:Uncharacterized protein n=1 Tax=Schizophyllum amplum TaxID=97359 RepID=A0A550C7I9_9AGAR|nr:hypothetical protein BD626DRAFT_549493 [Auriculariopsis ampla]
MCAHSLQTEHRNPEGRTYWFNTGTRESVWEKPDDLKTPFEKALTTTKWKEYFSGGRKYYYHTETKESKWDMPEELLLLLEKVEKGGPGAAATPQRAHTGGTAAQNGLPTVAGVDPTWTWERTMRAIITDPLYRALNSLAEKKAAFEKFTAQLKAKEQEEKETRMAKLRPALRNMLKGNPNVFHYTTFSTADKLFAQHPIWQQARIESERRHIFEEYVNELKEREMQETRASRTRATQKVVALFKQLNIDVLTRWRTAHKMLLDSEAWNDDPELQKLPSLDILLAFEDYARVTEREFEEQTRRAQVEKTRKERKAREGFRNLLQELVTNGTIKARSKWKEVYPVFKDDIRYLDMLGNPGSNPLELFWDKVDELDQVLDKKMEVTDAALKRRAVASAQGEREAEKGEDVQKEQEDVKMEDAAEADKRPEIKPETTEGEFLDLVKDDSEVKEKLSDEDLQEIYSTMLAAALQRQADEKRRFERKQRHLQDDLRYALKKLPEPIDLNMSFEDAVPLMQHLPEYTSIADDEGRRAAFAKFVKRQKERLREAASEDGGSQSGRKRKEPMRDRDYDRDAKPRERGGRYRQADDYDRRYDRDYRSRHGGGHRDDRRDRRTRAYSRDWDEPRREDPDRDLSVAREEPIKYELDERADKRIKYEREDVVPARPREDTPEEGEI